jgi:hypothetical protein
MSRSRMEFAMRAWALTHLSLLLLVFLRAPSRPGQPRHETTRSHLASRLGAEQQSKGGTKTQCRPHRQGRQGQPVTLTLSEALRCAALRARGDEAWRLKMATVRSRVNA